MRIADNYTSRLGFLFALSSSVLFGCADDSSTSSPSSTSFGASVGALASEMAACGQELSDCTSAAKSDADARSACRASFKQCQDAAVASADEDLEDGANSCATDFRTCRQDAADRDAQRACSTNLRACLGQGGGKPEGDAQGDGGSAEDSHGNASSGSPVASCIDALRVCIESDVKARTCTQPLLACLQDAVSQGHAGSDEGDAGSDADDDDDGEPDEDDGEPDEDDGEPGQGDDHAVDADAGAADAAQTCRAAYDACVEGGTARKDCALQLKSCER